MPRSASNVAPFPDTSVMITLKGNRMFHAGCPRLVVVALFWCALSFGLVSDEAFAGRFEVSSPQQERVIISEIRASHFLTQATFGPTMDEIQALAARIRAVGYRSAISEWVDVQMQLPATSQVDTLIAMMRDNGYPDFENQDPDNVPNRMRADAWWHNSITAEDQLRQRMAWALSQIFVVNDSNGFNNTAIEPSGLPRCAGHSHYYDIFTNNAFGNYRDVLGEVTRHPIMGNFLTHLNNRKADPSKNTFPDENYARECMQLFTIGLYKVKDLSGEYKLDRGELIPTYDNEDIDTMARVFTGWTYNSHGFAGKANWTQLMKNYNLQHDRDAKVLLDGTTLPARNSGTRDTDAALDMLFNQLETSPFVSRLLIQRFTHSNPTPRYVGNVARWFHGGRRFSRGDLSNVVKGILLNREATNLRIKRIRDANQRVIAVEVNSRPNNYTSLREPTVRVTHFLRAFKARSVGAGKRFYLGDMRPTLNQSPYKSPSVFNFYSPDHQPAGALTGTELVAPEFEILTSVSVNELHNFFADALRTRRIVPPKLKNRRVDIVIDLDDPYDVAKVQDYKEFRNEGLDDLMEYLDILLCQGTLSETTKTAITAAIKRAVTSSSTTVRRRNAVQSAITLVLTSPDCAIAD